MSGFYWLASYPKSGNTWLRLMLQSVLAGGGPVDINSVAVGPMIGTDRARFDDLTGLCASDLTPAELMALRPQALRAVAATLTRPLYAKTHDARLRLQDGDWLIPPDVTLGAIYIVRDPRDVAVSLARHMAVDIDGAIALMADTHFGLRRDATHLLSHLPEFRTDWSTNVASWLDPVPFPVHLVRYEALRAAPEATLTGVLATLRIDAAPETVRAAVAATALGVLQRQERAGGFQEWGGAGAFFGEGRVGGWRTRLTPEQAARIAADHGTVMRRLDYAD